MQSWPLNGFLVVGSYNSKVISKSGFKIGNIFAMGMWTVKDGKSFLNSTILSKCGVGFYLSSNYRGLITVIPNPLIRTPIWDIILFLFTMTTSKFGADVLISYSSAENAKYLFRISPLSLFFSDFFEENLNLSTA